MKNKKFKSLLTGFIYRVVQVFPDGSALMFKIGNPPADATFTKKHIKNNMEEVS